MANYTNKLGDIFTEEEIDAAALENGVDVDTIISRNELSMQAEEADKDVDMGKEDGVVAKEPPAAPKKKSGSSSKNTSSASNGKKKYPWDPANTNKGRGNQLANFKTGKETKKAKEADVKKSKAVVNSFVDSQTNSANPFAIDTPLNVSDPFNTGANITKKTTTKKVKEPDFNVARIRLASQMGEADPNAVPGSFGYPTFKAAKEKEAKAAAIKEDERVDFESRMSGIVLRNNNEAKKWYEDNLNNSQLTESDYTDIDTYIESEIARNNTLQNTDGTGGYEINAAQSQEARMRAGASGNIVGTKKYQAFYDETKKIKNKLKQAGKLNDYSEEEILEQAAALWKKNEIVRRKESKFRDSLEETTNISDVAKSVVNDYVIKKSTKEANDFVKETVFKESLDRTSESYINQIKKIDKQLKPKGYKFTSQQELDEQNALIVNRNNLIKDINNNEELIDLSINKINKLSDSVDDLSLQGDMFSRDYTNLGLGKKLYLNFANQIGGGVAGLGLYVIQDAEMAYDALGLEELIGMENPITYLKNVVSDKKSAIEDRLTYEFAKPRTGSTEAYLEQAGDLFISQAPNLLLMALTGGGSTAEKVIAEQIAKEAAPSLLARTGKFAKDYLTLNAQTGAMAGVSTGGKYLEMVNEERNGYYTEDGKFIKPDYNAFQLIVAPAAFGYVEGVFEKSTGKVLERGKSFFKTAVKQAPEEWKKFNVVTTKKLLKQAGINIVGAQGEEQLSEQLTNFGQNTINKVLLGKEVSLFENTGTVFKDTAMLTAMLSGIPIIAGTAIRSFMSKTTAKQLDDNARQIASILYKLDTGTDLSEISREALEKEKQKIEAQSTALLQKTISDIDAMPVSTFDYINKAQAKIADLINKANQINESDGDAKSKAEDLAILKNQYIRERGKLNTLVSGIENVKTFGRPISSIGRAQLIELNTERVEAFYSGAGDVVMKNIDAKIESIYKKEGVDLKEAREQEFQENLKAAEELGKSANVKVIVANNAAEAKVQLQKLVDDKLVTKEDADVDGFEGSDASIITNTVTGKSYIVIDKAQSINKKSLSVGSHEFLHKLLQKTLSSSNTQIELGKQLQNYLMSSNPELFLNASVLERLESNYANETEGNYNEEILTVFSDALLNGNIKYNESFFTKLGDTIRRYLQDLGLMDIKFDSGRDVFNFIRDYNATIKKGGSGKNAAFKKLFKESAKGKLVTKEDTRKSNPMRSKSIEDRMDKLDAQLSDNEIDLQKYESEMKKLEQEEFEQSKKTYEEEKKTIKKEPTKKSTTNKEPAEISEAAAKAKAKLDAIGNDPKGFNPNNPAIYDELDKMVKVKSRNYKTSNGTIIDLTNKNKGGLDGFSMEEMTSYVTVSMLPYIQKFDPSKNDSLYGYINAQLANRMKAALKSGQVADVVFTEDVTEMTKLSNEDVEVKTQSLPEVKKFQNIFESGVFSPDVIENIQAKLLPILRTLKSKVNEKTTLNKTVAPIINEIRNEIGKQADIDIKKAMGGKEDQVFQNFLITNKKTILENLTTTWLMGKDNGKTVSGGMPFAVQKQVNGRWLNYPEWIGKKIDREAVTTDLAGRTSGTELVRRLPEVNKNISTEEFLSALIDLKNGDIIRGRKESLAKAMSEELAFDLISDDIANEGPLYKALEKNQEILGAELEKLTLQNFDRLIERGNIKRSLNSEQISEIGKLINSAFAEMRDPNFNGITNKPSSSAYKLIKKLEEIDEDEINEVILLFETAVKSYRQMHWKSLERFIGEILRKKLSSSFNIINYGLNNAYLPDIVIRPKNIKGRIIPEVVIEIKKSADSNIPLTSSTGNSLLTKFNNGLFGEKSNEESPNLLYDSAEKIVNYIFGNITNKNTQEREESFLQKVVREELGIDNAKTSAKAGNIKLTKDQVITLQKAFGAENYKNNILVGGRRYVKEGGKFDVSVAFAKTLNNAKAKPQDAIIISDRVFDYFKGYPDLDSFENIFKSLGKDFPESDFFQWTVQLQINGDVLTSRGYLNFNEKYIEDISKYINEKGNNLAILSKSNIEKMFDAKYSIQNEKALTNANSSNMKSKSISTISDFINFNKLKRIDAETSFDVLNDLNKEIENYWGIVPNDIIVKMGRAVDYAFDVIENRENEGGPLMAAVNDALNLETVKFAEKQLNEFIDKNIKKGPKYSKNLDFQFNDILERNTGVEAFTKVSDVVAKRTGIKKNTLSFFVPPSADDFRGLTTYMFAGKGKQGEQDQEFFDKNLTVPYVKGINTLDSVRQSIRKEYKMLLNNFPEIKKKLEKLTPDKGFTYDQAVRVYLWSSTGKDVPGLSRTDKNKLLYFVKQNPDLLAFANALSITGRQDGGWIDPSTTWDSETIISDLHNITEGAGRKKYLEEFIENADAIFTKENLNKIQSIYGTNVREALEDSLYRMKNGKNRPEGTDRVTNAWMNWINGSTAAIMFFNTRSALLQTISAMNFINWNDNNPYMAGKAFLNQKQYWSDFAMIINSDKLKERRSGLKADVTQAEIANAANSAKNKFHGVISYLQKIGFTPTQAADSFSIAVSGATFYRNRINTYLKAGDTVEVAEEKAFNDFSIITDQSMQSADPMYVSKQQTTALGRIILAFGNTPMQYNRLIKKATLDLVNKRGDWKTNISKIVYYGALQNMLFSALQSALFVPLGYDDDEEPDTSKMTKEEKKAYEKLKKKHEDKITNVINGMADTLLRGSGVYGAAIATVKNTTMEYFKQEEKEMFADHAYTVLALTSVSPPISSKARKLYGSIRISKFEKDVIAERGWEVTRDGKLNLAPNYRILGNVTVATTNLPLDRVVEKVNNMAEVMDSRNTKLQRAALALGWKDWELNVKNEENEAIKATAKIKRKEEGIKKAIETRAENKRLEEERYRSMSVGEKAAYRKEKKEEKRKQKLLKRKRKMG